MIGIKITEKVPECFMNRLGSSISMLILSILCGCSAQKSPTKLEVSHGFAISDSMDGGFIVSGQSASGKTFSIALTNGLSKDVVLDNDTWTVHAIGWKGPVKFTGDTYCGSVVHNNTDSKTIEISVSMAGCTTASFTADVQLHPTRFLGCSSFSWYDSGNDTHNELTAAKADAYCDANAPIGFKNQLKYYKLIARDNTPTLKAGVFESGCLAFDGSTNSALPSNKFSFEVKAFRNFTDCQSNGPHQTYIFPEGFNKGNNESFDRLVHSDAASNVRVVLPTFISRRGKSPFLDMIPRVKCEASGGLSQTDCLPDFNDSVGVNVPWQGSSSSQQFLTKEKVVTCLPTLLSNSRYFNLESCEIRDDKLFASVRRNEFTCHNNQHSGIKDIFTADDKVLILKSQSGVNDVVEIYSTAGKFLQKIPLNLPTYQNVAGKLGNDGFHLYVTNGNLITKHVTNFSIVSPPETKSSSIAGSVMDLDIMDIDHLLYANETGDFGIFNWTIGNGTVSSIVTSTFNNSPISKITHTANKIFIIQGGLVKSHNFSSGSIDNTGTPLSGVSNASFFTVDLLGKIYIETSNGIETYSTETLSPLTSPDILDLATIRGLAAIRGQLLAVNGDSLKVYTPVGSAFVSATTVAQKCDEPIQIGSTTISFRTQETNQFDLYKEGLDLLGRTNFTKASEANTLFDLEHDGEMTSGGALQNIQEHLSKGVSTLLGAEGNCNDIKAKISTTSRPIYAATTIRDPFKGNEEFNVTITVNRSVETIPQWICSVNTSAGCTETFDLNLTYTVAKNNILQEKAIMKLKCGSKLGVFESLEGKNQEVHRKFLVWNTVDYTKSRFESYQKDSTDSSIEKKVTSFVKQGGKKFASRTVTFRQSATSVEGSASELQMSASGILAHKRMSLHDSSLASFNSNTSAVPTYDEVFSVIRDSIFNFNGYQSGSAMYNNSSIYAPGTYLTMDGLGYNTTMIPGGIDLTIGALSNSGDLEAYFTLTP
jgi:hypothetical protein